MPKPEPKPQPKPQPASGPTTKFLSADDSNSAASAAIVRKLIRAGRYVQPAVVRTYELLNYYTFVYPAPPEGKVAIIPQLKALKKPGEYSLQVAVRGPDRKLDALPAMAVTLLVDTSGSMAGDPFALAKAFVHGLVDRMRPGDRLSLVTVNRNAQVLLEGHTIDRTSHSRIEKLLAGVEPSDVTDLQKGVVEAYRIAGKTYDAARLNRVILISDGADNSGSEATALIAKHAEDSDRQGIYLAGIGVGEGFNDSLMDAFTDKGRGAYLFLDSPEEVARALDPERFAANFDLAAKNIRLKMVMPAGWKMEEFHGEQVSSRREDIVPQYLSPNDQMIYHLTISCGHDAEQAAKDKFAFEAEYTPLGGKPDTLAVEASVAQMLDGNGAIVKGDAVVAYGEMLKKIKYPLDQNRDANLVAFDEAWATVKAAQRSLKDPELQEILDLLERYRRTVEFGEQLVANRDQNEDGPDAVLGISTNTIKAVEVRGVAPAGAVKALSRLGNSTRVLPMEGHKFLVLSSGPVWNSSPAGGGQLGNNQQPDPGPAFLGRKPHRKDGRPIYDLHQVVLELQAPRNAKSFSFDFNFFSAEYPQYVNQNYNDTFYALLEAASTNGGKSTNIAFDANNNSIEVDNNYFQQQFHPIPNWGTGFDRHGSTGWLRTSWPIKGGETIKLTFSIHDEGDAVFDSLVVLDNFQWHDYPAVGTTDPLN